ncbi:MAG TPA: nuclear transport factor 2 family protein [Ktedonobacteraceae bacterium]|nr:nuclear transport factor 2 family protein [Ktedonobacteraceae bacterium]
MSQFTEADREAVKQAVLDYVEGVYEADLTKIMRSVHSDLAKRGFFNKEGETGYSISPMTFPQLLDLAKSYNKNSRIPHDAAKEVIVYDALDQIASAKLIAWWGIDYMHLAKYDGKWMVVNVLWQTHTNQDDRLADMGDRQITEV